MLAEVLCNVNWDCSFSFQGSQLRHHRHLLSGLHFRSRVSMPAGFCLSSLARLPHPICQALLVMSFNKFWRHKVSPIETDNFLLESLCL